MSYGYKCATCSRKDTEICEQCLGDQYAPIAKPATVQSAEELIDALRDIVHCAGGPVSERSARKQIADLFEAAFAAQRQAGREEAEKGIIAEKAKTFASCVKASNRHDEELSKRYAALEEAADKARCFVETYAAKNPKWMNDGREQDPSGAHRLLEELNKALSDLEAIKNI